MKPHTQTKPLDDLWEATSARLGMAEYYLPTENGPDTPQRFARAFYCRALRQATPEVMQALERDVYPTYVAALPALYEPQRDSFFFVQQYVMFVDGNLDEDDPVELLECLVALKEWATRFNVNEPWIIEPALFILGENARNYFEPWLPFDFFFGDPSAAVGNPFDPETHVFDSTLATLEQRIEPNDSHHYHRQFSFHHMGWDPLLYSRKTAVDSFRRQFEEALAIYIAAVESFVEERGYERTPVKREPEHYIWTAERHVRGWSWKAIADAHRKDVRTVKDAVLGIETLTGLRSFNRPRGRPRK